MQKVLILGAGMTGLAAAWKFLNTSSDYHVTLLERDPVPGGLAKSLIWNDFILDLGPHRFHTEIDEIKEFIKSFCEERMLKVPRQSRMYLNGHYIPYPVSPVHTLKALGLAQTISFTLSALAVLFRNRSTKSESYEEYVIGYYGKSLYERIFKPFAEKVWGLPPRQISAETARVRLRGDSIWDALKDSFLSSEQTYVAEFLYPPNGIGQIATQFAEDIQAKGGEIRCEHFIQGIHKEDGKIDRVAAKREDEHTVFDCDILINTIPLYSFFHLMNPSPLEEVAKSAEKLGYRAIVLLYLLFEGEFEINDTWLYYPEETVPFTRISVPGNFIPSRPVEGKTCLCIEFTCDVGDTIWNAKVDDLKQQVETVLIESGLVPQQAKDATAVHIRDGYPVYHIGYEESLQKALNYIESLRNCITVGRQGLFRHNNIDQAIQMGLHAAKQVMSGQADFSEWYANVHKYNDYRIVD